MICLAHKCGMHKLMNVLVSLCVIARKAVMKRTLISPRITLIITNIQLFSYSVIQLFNRHNSLTISILPPTTTKLFIINKMQMFNHLAIGEE